MTREWVLVRGIMSSSMHWHDFLEIFKHRFSQHSVHTPDILGNGTKNSHLTPTEISDNISGIRAQIPGSKQKLILGFSLGGILAIEWAQRHPEEVAGVILINSSSNQSPVIKRMTPWSMWQTFKIGMMENSPAREQQVLKLTTQLPTYKKSGIAQYFYEIEKKYPVRGDNFVRQMILANKIRLQKQPPQVPILILNSKNDRVVHPDCSKAISDFWNVPLVTHPTAGHDLTLEEPHWVADQVQSWFKQNFKSELESTNPTDAPSDQPDLKSITL